MSVQVNKMIGKKLRQAREKLNLTQAEVAKELGFASSQFVYMVECSVSKPPVDKLRDWCEIVEADYKQLVELMAKDYRKKLLAS